MLSTVAIYGPIVLMLMWMFFFMLGSLPLLILEHDTPLDARFIRGLFDVYYKAVMVVAAAGALTHGLAHRPVSTAGMVALGLVAFVSRRAILTRMDSLRATMTPEDTAGIRRFRQLHGLGMALNVVQLGIVCVGLVFVL